MQPLLREGGRVILKKVLQRWFTDRMSRVFWQYRNPRIAVIKTGLIIELWYPLKIYGSTFATLEMI